MLSEAERNRNEMGLDHPVHLIQWPKPETSACACERRLTPAKQGASALCVCMCACRTPVHLAARSANADMLKVLLDTQPDDFKEKMANKTE